MAHESAARIAEESSDRRPAAAALRGPAPLSFSSARSGSITLAPDVPVYNEPITIHRHGPLDAAALADA